jgi:hypothetical protein
MEALKEDVGGTDFESLVEGVVGLDRVNDERMQLVTDVGIAFEVSNREGAFSPRFPLV